MKAKTDRIIKDLCSTIKQSDKKGTSGYDTPAEVIRVDGDTAWVHIPGGVDETPVKLTIGAKKGDYVQVRVSGGSAWIIGNATAPPTDDRVANIASELAINAHKTANVANKKVEIAINLSELAEEVATRAQASADGKNTIYYGSTTPTTGQSGDTWFNGAEDNAIYIHNGTTWVKEELGEDAIANLSITNAKIVNGTIQSAKIANLDAAKITSGTIDTNRLDVSGIISVGGLATDAEVAVAKSEAIADGRKYADNYLTVISGTTGISVHDQNNVSNYVNINSSAINVVQNGTKVAQFGQNVLLGASSLAHLYIQSTGEYRGVELYRKLDTDENPVSVGWFGTNNESGVTACRIGVVGSSRFTMSESSLQAYNSSGTKYFEVSSSGITYGSNTVANTSNVATAKSEAISTASADATTKANTARKYADNYLTTISGTSGISVHSENDTSNYVNMNSTAVNIVQSGTNVASFKPTMLRLGESGKTRVQIQNDENYSGIEIFRYNSTSQETASVAWLSESSRIGVADGSHITLNADSGMNIYDQNNKLRLNASSTGISIFDYASASSTTRINVAQFNTTVRVGAIANSQSRVLIQPSGIDFISRDGNGNDSYLAHLGYASGKSATGTDVVAPYYTFGERASGNIGNYSVAEGVNTIASGFTSHAEGFWSTASGHYSHAEGDSTASGEYSHAGGYLSVASGYASHALGTVCVANGDSQCVVGRYNEPDTTSVFIVGCGTSSSVKNALTVSSAGSLSVSGNMILPTGTSIGTYKDSSKTQWMALIYGGSDGKITIGNGETTSVTVSAPINALYKITTKVITVEAGSANTAKNSADYTLSGSELGGTGYKPVGIVGATAEASSIFAFNYYIKDSTTLRAGFRRTATTSADYTVTFRILWLKATSA